MYIYNVTINVSSSIHLQWLNEMKQSHMQEVVNTGCFTGSKLLKLLFVEDEGHTYSAQYYFNEMKDIENYQKNFAPKLQAEMKQKFGNEFTAFRTILEEV